MHPISMSRWPVRANDENSQRRQRRIPIGRWETVEFTVHAQPAPTPVGDWRGDDAATSSVRWKAGSQARRWSSRLRLDLSAPAVWLNLNTEGRKQNETSH